MTMLDPNHPRQLTLLALLLPLACQAKVGLQASAHASTDGDVSASASISLPTVSIYREGDQLSHGNTGSIKFAVGEASLVGEKTFETLRAYADVMRAHPDLVVRIEGHTDSRGSRRDNLTLSRARANAVRSWLISAGISPDRLEAVGRGESSPKAPEPASCHDKTTEQAPSWCEQIWRQNRRSEFHIVEGGADLPEADTSDTAPPPRDDDERRLLPYVYLAPGLLQVPLGTRDETDTRKPSYVWGVGAGALWRRRRAAVAFGLGLFHSPVAVKTSPPTTSGPGASRCDDQDAGGDYECERVNDLRLLPELRVGGGTERLIGFARLAPGLALGTSKITGLVMTPQGLVPDTQRFTTPGFALDVGAGLWGRVWRGLFLGAEVDLSLSIYGRVAGSFHDDTDVAALSVRAVAGWQFRWRRP